ncbi:MAG: hypothetical protein V4687_18270 [Bacteroidota bacterium]
MKPNYLFTSILAVAAIAVSSCSTPKLAQQSVDNDDVYNSSAQAKTYVPAPVRQVQQAPADQYQEDDYYGTSDPYYDMDYSSRINRFSYGTPWRSYYDPYFYGSIYSPYSMYLGYNDFYGGGFGWGYMSSPFFGYNNWGFNNWGYGNYYGGGYYGGGFLGGGFLGGGYYGGGYYTGRTTNVPDYRARPYVGRENGVGANRGMARTATSTTRRTDAAGNTISERSRSERYNPNNNASAPARSDRSTAPQARPTRTESAPAARPAPTYTPPARTESSRSSGSSSSGSSSGSSGARPTRSGRG